jgi:hypothetical protein
MNLNHTTIFNLRGKSQFFIYPPEAYEKLYFGNPEMISEILRRWGLVEGVERREEVGVEDRKEEGGTKEEEERKKENGGRSDKVRKDQKMRGVIQSPKKTKPSENTQISEDPIPETQEPPKKEKPSPNKKEKLTALELYEKNLARDREAAERNQKKKMKQNQERKLQQITKLSEPPLSHHKHVAEHLEKKKQEKAKATASEPSPRSSPSKSSPSQYSPPPSSPPSPSSSPSSPPKPTKDTITLDQSLRAFKVARELEEKTSTKSILNRQWERVGGKGEGKVDTEARRMKAREVVKEMKKARGVGPKPKGLEPGKWNTP